MRAIELADVRRDLAPRPLAHRPLDERLLLGEVEIQHVVGSYLDSGQLSPLTTHRGSEAPRIPAGVMTPRLSGLKIRPRCLGASVCRKRENKRRYAAGFL